LAVLGVEQIQNGGRCHGNQGAKNVKFTKVSPTDSDFLGLSCSTRCESCSYQVSSISVWRVTCYDYFCAFQWCYHGNRGTNIMGWGDVRYYFAMAILVIILILIILLPHIFVRSIFRRCLDQTL
jgi:hypothetical protein